MLLPLIVLKNKWFRLSQRLIKIARIRSLNFQHKELTSFLRYFGRLKNLVILLQLKGYLPNHRKKFLVMPRPSIISKNMYSPETIRSVLCLTTLKEPKVQLRIQRKVQRQPTRSVLRLSKNKDSRKRVCLRQEHDILALNRENLRG